MLMNLTSLSRIHVGKNDIICIRTHNGYVFCYNSIWFSVGSRITNSIVRNYDSELIMTSLEKFLTMIGKRRIFCCQKIKEDGNLVGINGNIVEHDDKFLILKSKDSLHLINLDNVIELEYTPELEIVVPEVG